MKYTQIGNDWRIEPEPELETIQLTLHGIDEKPPSIMTIGEAASYLGLSVKVVRTKVPCKKTNGGHRRYLKSDLDRWLQSQQLPVKRLT